MSGNYEISEEKIIQAMENNEQHKYLEYCQARTFDCKEIKEKLKQEYTNRATSSKKLLISKNLFKGINTFAVPILTYSLVS